MSDGDDVKPRAALPHAPTIDAATLGQWMQEGRPLSILDVRPARERSQWSIPGSVHVDAYEALWARDPSALAEADLPLGTPVVTVCAAGRTSLLAAAVLAARGHVAYSLERGMRAWSLAWNSAEIAAEGFSLLQMRRVGKGCLSYVIASGGDALVIDPSLEAEVYSSLAADRGWRITRVLETHVHADHLSRARALASVAGAALQLPAQARVSYPHDQLRDGDVIPAGGRDLRVLRTEGHTGESSCFLLDGRFLFTGDTLFLKGVGRPDLEAGGEHASRRARQLFRSLRRLLVLPGQTLVLPGHTGDAIAFDGKPLCGTLAGVRGHNRLLALDEERFVEAITASIPDPPSNHEAIVRLNESGAAAEGDPATLEAGANRCAVA